MTTLVRVYDDRSEHEISVAVVDKAHQTVLDKPALDIDGLPLAPKLRKPLAETVADANGVPYEKRLKADLVEEVAQRNADRSADEQIVVDGNGTVKDLAAALDADDKEQGPIASPDVDEDDPDRFIEAADVVTGDPAEAVEPTDPATDEGPDTGGLTVDV